MTDTSIRVSDETRKQLNQFRAKYDITQGKAIRKLLSERGRIEYPYVTTCEKDDCDVKIAFDSPPGEYDHPILCSDCQSIYEDQRTE